MADNVTVFNSQKSNNLAQDSANVARGGAVILVGTVLGQFFGMLATIWMARVLGPEQYGIYALALSAILPIIPLANIGLPITIVRFLPIYMGGKDNAKVAGVLYSALIMGGGASSLITVVVISISSFMAADVFGEPRLQPVLVVLAFTIPLTVITDITIAATRGLKLMHFDALVKISKPLFKLLSWAILLYTMANGLIAATYATLIGLIFTTLFALVLTFKTLKSFFGHGIIWSFNSLLIYSFPLVLSTLMYAVSPRIDRLIVGIFADVREVGIYSAAASLIVVLRLTHSSIVTTFAPIVSDTYHRISKARARKLYILVTRWDARITFLGVLFFMLLAPEIMRLFGDNYAEALLPFLILSISVLVGTLPGPTGIFLQMTNRQKLDAVNAIIFLIVSPVAQVICIAWLGWVGAAVGVLLSAVILNAMQVIEINYIYKFNPFQSGHLIFSVISMAIVISSALLSLNANLFVRILTLLSIIVAFLAIVYHYRSPEDQAILETLIYRKRGKLKEL